MSLLNAIIVSACLGALIGLIRQWSEQRDGNSGADFGGVRTFTLWAVLGCASSYVSQHYLAAVFPLTLAAVAAQFIALHVRSDHDRHAGSTSFVAMLLAGLVGALVQWKQVQAAVLVAALTMVTLGSKKPVHAWTRNFTSEDIRATLQFAAITGVILPLVPNRAMGPYEAFNPFSTWMMVVLISGIGFGGYILMRMLGAQAGITVTGLVGGLASSTATTLAFSRRSKEDPQQSESYALAVVLACTVMICRVLFMIGFVNLELVRRLAVPMAIIAAPGLLYAAWSWFFRRKKDASVETPEVKNPLSLKTAIKFAIIYTVFAFLVKAATNTEWKESLLLLSFVSGLTDVDAIALLMANSVRDQSVAIELAVKAVILGTLGNSLTKAILAVALGKGALRAHVAIALGATIVAGAASFWWL
jgi:uncharacterized membrane protein (DUF4010 family)